MNNFLQLRIDKAEEHFYSLKSDRIWTALIVASNDVWLNMGPIHTNGMHERANITRAYYSSIDGTVEWIDQVHL